MKNIKISLFFSLLVSIAFTSCGDDDNNKDRERPVIKVISPKNNAVVEVGTDLIFKADFSDNETLASYKIDIHINDGNHSHSEKLTEPRGVTETIPFSFTKSANLSGQTASVDEKISIPFKILDTSDNKEKPVRGGEYHLVVYLTDKAGNESIVIQNIIIDGKEDVFGINIVSPKENEVIYIGDDITFKANFSNKDGLVSYKVTIEPKDASRNYLVNNLPNLRTVTESTYYSYDKGTTTISGTNYAVENVIEIPLTILDSSDNKRKKVQPGDYFLIVNLKDKTGFEAVVTRSIKFSN